MSTMEAEVHVNIGSNSSNSHSVSLSPAPNFAQGKKKVCPFFLIKVDFDQRPVHKHLGWTVYILEHQLIMSQYWSFRILEVKYFRIGQGIW